jgi:hypothetical protein
MSNKFAARLVLIATVVGISLLINSQAIAQGANRASISAEAASPVKSSGVKSSGIESSGIVEALSSTMRTEEFMRAERRNDVKTMRALLSSHGLQVLDPIPEMIPNCQPPTGYPIWTWIYYNGSWMYGWACLRTITPEPIDFSTLMTD